MSSLLLAAACGEDGELDSAEAAQARVTAAETAVSQAQSALDEANATFCNEAAQYVEAIDRYGRVFSDDATTVGDLTTAADDLAGPRRSVESSAEAVTEARGELTQANEELAEATAALAPDESSEPSTTTTTAPPLEPATIDRVRAAEEDLAAAAAGVTADSSVHEAETTLNSAAYALEIAWLRVIADAGCLSEDQLAEAVAAVAAYTASVQTALQTAGYYDGAIDGVYGPSTVAAVEALQTASHLPVTGYVDEATGAALAAAVLAVNGDAETAAVAHTAAVQSTLKLAGYWAGPVDGEWTPELTESLKTFQTELGVEPTGQMDVATLHALQSAIALGRAASDTTTTSTSSPATTTTTAVATSTTA